MSNTDKPLPEEIIDARDIIADDESFYDDDACPASDDGDGEHDWRLVAIIDGCEIYECACGLIDC